MFHMCLGIEMIKDEDLSRCGIPWVSITRIEVPFLLVLFHYTSFTFMNMG
jgi:hypothetical protein